MDSAEEEKMVRFNPDNLTIDLETKQGGYVYSIDLEKCTDSAAVLDRIFQVRPKTWVTPQIMSELIAAFDEACLFQFGRPVQGVFCSAGCDYEVSWSARTSERKDA